MTEKFVNIKNDLCRVERQIEIKENPLIKATIISYIKKVPFIGELINDSIDLTLSTFQKRKRDQFIEIILSDSEKITMDMVNDIEFIMNFAKTIEAVNKLSTNSKVKFFANLLRKSYLSGEKIQNDDFEEYLRMLNTLSYREIEYIVFLYQYQKKNSEKNLYSKCKISKKYFWNFGDEFAKRFSTGKFEYIDIYKKLVITGGIQEIFDLHEGSISQNSPSEFGDEFSITGSEIDTDYFWVTESFEKFILKIE